MKFLGYQALSLFSQGNGWVSIIDEKDSRLILDEAVTLISKGRVLQKLLTVKDAIGRRRAVNFKLYQGAAEDTIHVELSPAGLTDVALRYNTEQQEIKLDFMIIDTSFVPQDANAWIEGIRARAKQMNLVDSTDQLKFFIISDGESRKDLMWLKCKDVLGLFYKPVDIRQLLFLLSEHLPNKFTVYHYSNLGWSQPSLPVHVAKAVDLEAISEYGATLKSKQKLVPGSLVYLRKHIYDSAPYQCLAARVYACEEHPKEKNTFQVFATYFGITDAFLKFARTWIRENYASKKQN